MPTLHRLPCGSSLARCVAILTVLLPPSTALAGWGVAPVEIRAASASYPLVAATSDGRGGAIVVWQEGSAPGGVLQAQRITANGDLGSWAHGPVPLCSIDIPRHALGAVSDGAGGAYVWWLETAMLYLTRLTADGFIAAGWAARGFHLGELPTPEFRPLLKNDGEGGAYIGWLQGPVWYSFQMRRFGPTGLPAGGWPPEGRNLHLGPTPDLWSQSFGFDPTPSGGLWVGAQVFDGNFPGVTAVQLLDGSGAPATGWETGALGLRLLGSAIHGEDSRMGLMALQSDAQGSVFVAALDQLPLAAGDIAARLWRLDPNGSPSTGWTYDGLELEPVSVPSAVRPSEEGTVRALPAPNGGVHVGLPSYPAGAWPRSNFTRRAADGVLLPGAISVEQSLIETALRDDGGLFVGACKPFGPLPNRAGDAYVGLWQTPPGAGFVETQGPSSDLFYRDVGVASTEDGGAIFAWSQVLGRQGVFAVRVGHDGPVTSVPPAPTALVMRISFTPGLGVQVAGATGRVTLRLHDLTGREVARGESADAGEWTVPGTAELPSGMYFAKAVADGREKRAKVIVIR